MILDKAPAILYDYAVSLRGLSDTGIFFCWSRIMREIGDMQCGRCSHFGADRNNEPRLVQIRTNGQATPDVVEPCGHPNNERVSLKVTPFATCAGFEPAPV